jgi:hypothetical protein
MPMYEVSWKATVHGVTRVEADNHEEAEQAVGQDCDPPLEDGEVSDVDVVAVEKAD